MSAKRYTIACLAGDGVGPELMGEASRLVQEVSRFHGFAVDDVHPAFGGEAFVRHGEPLPRATRDACLDADAVLVGAPRHPALERLAGELDLRAAVTWVRADASDVLLLSPLSADASAWTVGRAFALARRRRARLATVDEDASWRELVDEAAARNDGLHVEHLTVAAGLPALAFERGRFDVVVSGPLFADALADVAASPQQGARVVAGGRLAEHGPGLFMPEHGAARAIAGQGVANPSSMLLASALMLGCGLGEWGAADTLQRAVLGALGGGVRTPDMRGRGLFGTTRDFTRRVQRELPQSHGNAEFHREAYAT